MGKANGTAPASAPRKRRYVELELGGTKLQLLWTWNDLADAEDKLKGNLMLSASHLFTNTQSFSDLRGLLYGCTRAAHPDMTDHAIGELMSISNVPEVYSALLESYKASTDDSEMKSVDPTGGAEAGERPSAAPGEG